MAVASRSQRRQTAITSSRRCRLARRPASAPGSRTPGSRRAPAPRAAAPGRGRCRRPTPPLAAISLAALVRPAAPRSCRATKQPRRAELEAAVHQLALGERVAHLHRRALVLVLVQLGRRQHAGAADAVAAGAVADQHQARCRGPGRRRAACRRRDQHADAHGVDQARLLVAVVEAPPRRRPWARRCSCRSGRCRRPRGVNRWRLRALVSSPKRSESSSAIGRAPIAMMSRTMPPTPVAAPSKGSTARRVVVALDLQRHRDAVAHVHHAGVLAGALQHARRRWWGSPAAAARLCL